MVQSILSFIGLLYLTFIGLGMLGAKIMHPDNPVNLVIDESNSTENDKYYDNIRIDLSDN